MKKFLLKVALLLVIVGGFLLLMFQTSYKVACSEPVDISDGLKDASQLQIGTAIEAEIDALIGPVSVETVTQKSRLWRSTSTYYYYIAPIFVGDEDVYYVSYKIDEKDVLEKRMADDIATITMEYLYGEREYYGNRTMTVTGGIFGVDSEVKQHMIEYLNEMGMFDNPAQASTYVLGLSLGRMNAEKTKKGMYINIGAIALGVLILILLLLSTIFGGEKYSKRRKQLRALGNKTITIGGKDYVIAEMTIDRLIWEDKISQAKKELIIKYYATEEEADRIIENWRFITRV